MPQSKQLPPENNNWLPRRPRILTVDEVATELRVSAATVIRLLHNGELEALPFKRLIRITADTVDAFVARGNSCGRRPRP